MRRRDFIKATAAATVAWPVSARAQQAARKIPPIGVLWHAGSQEEEGEYFTSFLRSFRELNYVEGRNIAFEHRYANEEYERFGSLAAEMVALNVDVLVAVTRSAIAAAQAATKTIPIVMIAAPDPVGNKFAATLARPGGNITGLSTMALDIVDKRLELIKEMVPGLTRAALLVNPGDPIVTHRVIGQVEAAAAAINVAVQVFEARKPPELDLAFEQIAQANVQGVFSPNDPMFHNERARIARLALARRLPILLQNRLGAQAGALMSFGTDANALFRRAGYYVDKILKGEKPGEILIEQPTRFELLINLKTAKALGVTVPQTLLARADEVIE